MVKRPSRRYRKLLVRFRWDEIYNQNLFRFCRCVGTIKVGEPEVGEILTQGSLILTLSKGISRKKVTDCLLDQQPTLVRSVTVLGLKYRKH